MEPFSEHTDDAELTVSVDDSNMIHIRMAGNLTEDNLDMVRRWDTKVRDAMHYVAARMPGHILTLIDVSGGKEADEKAVELLKDLMAHNKQYATRTAVWGANYFMRLLVELALVATGRDNMRLFATREDALEWLHEL